uniref:Uncharacterized protein n=1 Tax=Arundo donax TaxID=35708 RepID=A0A0A8Z1T5_ARUDO
MRSTRSRSPWYPSSSSAQQPSSRHHTSTESESEQQRRREKHLPGRNPMWKTKGHHAYYLWGATRSRDQDGTRVDKSHATRRR